MWPIGAHPARALNPFFAKATVQPSIEAYATRPFTYFFTKIGVRAVVKNQGLIRRTGRINCIFFFPPSFFADDLFLGLLESFWIVDLRGSILFLIFCLYFFL